MSNQTDPRLEWVLFGLRWLVVVSGLLFVAAARMAAPTIDSSAVRLFTPLVTSYAIYNLVTALLTILNIRGPMVNMLTLALDSLAAMLFFWASGAEPLVLLGMGLLPVGVSAMRSKAMSGLILVVVLVFISFVVATVMGTVGTQWPLLLLAGLLLLIPVALIFGQELELGRTSRNSEEHLARARAEQQRAHAMAVMTNTLGATLDYNAVLETVLDVGTLGLRDAQSTEDLVAVVLLFDGTDLRVGASRRLIRQDLSRTVPGKEGIIAQALKQAEPVFGTNAKDDPELIYFVGFQEVKSVLAIPLRAGFDSYGVLLFGSQVRKAFSTDYVELLTALGTQATIALQNAVLYQNLIDEKERLVEVEEEARKKLARDLHDGPTQSIAAIAMRVNYIRRLVESKPVEANEELGKVEDLARKATKDIRHMLFTLRPLVLETQGLGPALEQFAVKVKETHDLNVTVQIQEGVTHFLEGHAQGVLFYIVEEAVGNARKHAQAEHIYVRLYRRENYVVVEIQDDGVGFDTEKVTNNYEQRGSLGMVNMRERAALVEGILRIDSAKGKGTKISVLVPIKTNPERQAPVPNGSFTKRPTQLTSHSMRNIQ